jgi:hypothetical protein
MATPYKLRRNKRRGGAPQHTRTAAALTSLGSASSPPPPPPPPSLPSPSPPPTPPPRRRPSSYGSPSSGYSSLENSRPRPWSVASCLPVYAERTYTGLSENSPSCERARARERGGAGGQRVGKGRRDAGRVAPTTRAPHSVHRWRAPRCTHQEDERLAHYVAALGVGHLGGVDAHVGALARLHSRRQLDVARKRGVGTTRSALGRGQLTDSRVQRVLRGGTRARMWAQRLWSLNARRFARRYSATARVPPRAGAPLAPRARADSPRTPVR